MPVSQRFLTLLRFQLAQLADRDDLRSLIVYVAQPGSGATPDLVPVGQWPGDGLSLPTIGPDSPLRQPAEQRRWLPLRHQTLLLGALQVETTTVPWPASLMHRLQAVALCLTEALCLDLERQRIQADLQQQRQQTKLLLHQLRNPLAALRTFGQLLLRRLEPGSPHRSLVEGLLAEERQLNRYVDALDQLGAAPPQPLGGGSPTPLLLPPLQNSGEAALTQALAPLLSRAAATATLQKRPWEAPAALPEWRGDSGAVAEIIANLLENAFRYSPAGSVVGLHTAALPDGGWGLTVWDGGPPIPESEREAIFASGRRGSSGAGMAGTGLGLALGRELAASLGGQLDLLCPPARVDPALPGQGNAFRLRLPPGPPAP